MGKNKRVPAIRFKGFTEEWVEKKLEEVIDLRSGKDYKHLSEGSIPVYGTGGYMLSVNDALSYEENAIGIGRKGTINKPYILYAPFWTVDTLFYATVKNNYDLNFVFNIFQRIDWQKRDESTGVPSLSKVAINTIDVFISKISEQKQIGEFFQNVDSLINANQRKLDKLKNIKKACLEKMFPRKGSTIPEIRFKGFTEEWEEKTLGEIAPLRGGFAFESSKYKNSGIPIIRISNIFANGTINGDFVHYDEDIDDNGFSLEKGAVLLAMSGATTGKVAVLNNKSCDKYYQNQRVGFFTKKIEVDYSFVSTIVGSRWFIEQLRNVLVAGAQPNVSAKDIDSFMYLIPKDKKEQQQIGTFFKNLDNLIAKNEQQLEKLKNIKKACLEKMFVNKEDAI